MFKLPSEKVHKLLPINTNGLRGYIDMTLKGGNSNKRPLCLKERYEIITGQNMQTMLGFLSRYIQEKDYDRVFCYSNGWISYVGEVYDNIKSPKFDHNITVNRYLKYYYYRNTEIIQSETMILKAGDLVADEKISRHLTIYELLKIDDIPKTIYSVELRTRHNKGNNTTSMELNAYELVLTDKFYYTSLPPTTSCLRIDCDIIENGIRPFTAEESELFQDRDLIKIVNRHLLDYSNGIFDLK